MPDEFGIMSPVRARLGFRAAWQLIQQGKSHWSGSDLDSYLLHHGQGRHAAWNRGFAACIVVNAGVPEVVADWILQELNPGDWKAPRVPSSYLRMARHLSNDPERLVAAEIEKYRLLFLEDMGMEDEEPLELTDDLNQSDSPAVHVVSTWFDEMFSCLNCDVLRMSIDHVLYDDSSQSHRVFGDWADAFDRATGYLSDCGWTVLELVEYDESWLEPEIDEIESTITFPVVDPSSVRDLLRLLTRVTLVTQGFDCNPCDGVSRRGNVETELIACLVGRALGIRFDEASAQSVRSQLLKTRATPSDLFDLTRASVIGRSSAVLEHLGIDVLELAD